MIDIRVGAALAQAPDVPIEIGMPISLDETIIKSANALREEGKLLDLKQVAALVESPRPADVTLLAPATEQLSPSVVYRRARAAFVRLGWLSKDNEDDTWRMDLANGYAIARGGVVATAAHILEPPEDTEEAYLVGVTADNRALPVSSILAVENDLDAAIVRIEGFNGTPLPLNEKIAPGDQAFCFSDPTDERGYFSTGIVNRFYWSGTDSGDLKTLAGVKNLRLDVGTAWAPGSSGAAVLDSAGNAIGHVWTISGFEFAAEEPATDDETRSNPGEQEAGPNAEPSSDKAEDAEPVNDPPAPEASAAFVLNSATPARGVRLLVESMRGMSSKPQEAAGIVPKDDQKAVK